MTIDDVLDLVGSLDGSLVLSPDCASGHPDISWGDHFFYFAPDGVVPTREQPYATIVTKNYPDDRSSDLDVDGRWRINIHVGRAVADELVGTASVATDSVIPHPIYGGAGWISVVSPAERTASTIADLLRKAHGDARRRSVERG